MPKTLTVGQLRRALSDYPDDCEVIFGSAINEDRPNLTFYRTKTRGPGLVQVEFNEVVEIISPPPES